MDQVEQNIVCGDALVELKKVATGSVDLIVTDPPYNLSKNYGNNTDDLSKEEYLAFTRAWVKEAVRVLKPHGTIYAFMGVRYISHLFLMMEESGLYFNSWITWHYTQGIGKTRGFSPRHDDILMFTKSENFTFNLDAVRIPQKFFRTRNNMRGANPGNVWEFSHVHFCEKGRINHPTQKPEGLFERMILASSNEGDTVLDCFLGTGTTLRVCQQLGRKGIGIEINPSFVEVAKVRLLEPFSGFDSIDERALRIPQNLGKEKDTYMESHKKWFLNNHQNVCFGVVDKNEENLLLFNEDQAEYGAKKKRITSRNRKKKSAQKHSC